MLLLLKKVYNLSDINFSSIFSIFDNGDCTAFAVIQFRIFFKTGTTFEVLSTGGKTPVMKESLNKSLNCFETSSEQFHGKVDMRA